MYATIPYPLPHRVVHTRHHEEADAQALVSLKKYMTPSSSLLQGKHLPFTPSPLRLNIFSLICDPFADPIISLHSRDISLFTAVCQISTLIFEICFLWRRGSL